MPERQRPVPEEGRISFYLQQKLVEKAKTTFLHFATVLKNATLYPPAHPFLLGSVEQFLLALEDLFSKRGEASFHIIGGELFFETFSVPIEEGLARVLEEITRKEVGSIIFRPGITREELVSFSYLMIRDAKSVTAQGEMSALLREAGITHILSQRLLTLGKGAEASRGEDEQRPSEIFSDAIDTVKEIVHSAQHGKMLNVRRMQGVVHTMVDSILENRDALLGLATIKVYDEYTFAHSVNVSILCIAMGAFLSYERSQIATLGIAGMLHDIGKVKVPLEILGKPDMLTNDEWEIVKRHPVDGAMILSNLPGVSRLAMVSAFQHHQHYDFRGYPQRGEVMHLHPFSRVVSIADAYDALTSMRIYYQIATPPDEAVRIMLAKRGTAFDPVLVKVFVNLVGMFPIGTLLRLHTGETGLVVHQTRDLLRPRVLLLRDFDGTEKEEVSLLEMEMGSYKRSVVGTLDPGVMNINVKQYFL